MILYLSIKIYVRWEGYIVRMVDSNFVEIASGENT